MKRLDLDSSAMALFLSRWVLGLMFLMPGFFKVFSEGTITFAQENFVGDYRDTWIPVWLLWTLGFLVPYIELLAGGLLCLGFRVKESLASLGCVLIMVTYGHLLKDPFFDMSGDVFPLLVLAVFIFMVPREKDRLSLDWLMNEKSRTTG